MSGERVEANRMWWVNAGGGVQPAPAGRRCAVSVRGAEWLKSSGTWWKSDVQVKQELVKPVTTRPISSNIYLTARPINSMSDGC